jgi:hypothetical protein
MSFIKREQELQLRDYKILNLDIPRKRKKKTEVVVDDFRWEASSTKPQITPIT